MSGKEGDFQLTSENVITFKIIRAKELCKITKINTFLRLCHQSTSSCLGECFNNLMKRMNFSEGHCVKKFVHQILLLMSGFISYDNGSSRREI